MWIPPMSSPVKPGTRTAPKLINASNISHSFGAASPGNFGLPGILFLSDTVSRLFTGKVALVVVFRPVCLSVQPLGAVCKVRNLVYWY